MWGVEFSSYRSRRQDDVGLRADLAGVGLFSGNSGRLVPSNANDRWPGSFTWVLILNVDGVACLAELGSFLVHSDCYGVVDVSCVLCGVLA